MTQWRLKYSKLLIQKYRLKPSTETDNTFRPADLAGYRWLANSRKLVGAFVAAVENPAASLASEEAPKGTAAEEPMYSTSAPLPALFVGRRRRRSRRRRRTAGVRSAKVA